MRCVLSRSTLMRLASCHQWHSMHTLESHALALGSRCNQSRDFGVDRGPRMLAAAACSTARLVLVTFLLAPSAPHTQLPLQRTRRQSQIVSAVVATLTHDSLLRTARTCRLPSTVAAASRVRRDRTARWTTASRSEVSLSSVVSGGRRGPRWTCDAALMHVPTVPAAHRRPSAHRQPPAVVAATIISACVTMG